jgi:deoxyadenosine/deoxycytidine kinase
MKRSKKSSNKKPVIIFIHGPIAVGKFTVAKALSKKLGYKLAHNHYVNDFLLEIFERDSYYMDLVKDKLRYFLLENAAKAGINLVVTHTYTHNFVSRTGLSDSKYVQMLEKKLKAAGARFYPVHLKASTAELLRRVGMSSRKKFAKLTSRKVMRRQISFKDWSTTSKLKNNYVIDNTNLSPQKVSEMIIAHFKLK